MMYVVGNVVRLVLAITMMYVVGSVIRLVLASVTETVSIICKLVNYA